MITITTTFESQTSGMMIHSEINNLADGSKMDQAIAKTVHMMLGRMLKDVKESAESFSKLMHAFNEGKIELDQTPNYSDPAASAEPIAKSAIAEV